MHRERTAPKIAECQMVYKFLFDAFDLFLAKEHKAAVDRGEQAEGLQRRKNQLFKNLIRINSPKLSILPKGPLLPAPTIGREKKISWVYTQPSLKPTKQSENIVQSGHIAMITTVTWRKEPSPMARYGINGEIPGIELIAVCSFMIWRCRGRKNRPRIGQGYSSVLPGESRTIISRKLDITSLKFETKEGFKRSPAN